MAGAGEDLSTQLVDAINDVSGVHPGHRAAHAQGIVCAGTFTATPAAIGLTRAAHMKGDPVRTTVRFSNGGGNPDVPDYAREGRGMAVKFYLPDDSRTDVVALSLPCFIARTPEDFLEFTRLRRPDPETGQPNLEKVGAWVAEHPESQQAIQAGLAAPPPASYAQVIYNSIHAYRWLNESGEGRFVRYRWTPEAGEGALSDEDARAGGRRYLQDELRERLEREPAAFRLYVKIAAEGDDPDDPTVPWPEERETVEVGRLEITGLDTEREVGDDILVFDPTRVTDGIECSGDRILLARPGAYSVSVERRAGVKVG
jgi:catalase